MRFDIMTLFPDMVETILSESIIGRARKAGLVDIGVHYIRDFAVNEYGRVDDTPYGGGKGMLMMAPPIFDCYQDIIGKNPSEPEQTRVIYLSPKGQVFTQKKAEELLSYDHLILLCGHYEGVDQRVIDEIVDEEISIGDYVLTGGELPACIVVDSVCRMIDGVLADEMCYKDESISSGLLEYPQYTRPYEFHGATVPDVLLSGHHAKIDEWRHAQALATTEKYRPDLLESGDSKDKITHE